MSVYTTVEETELQEFLSHYQLGQLVACQGISAGIENTNYFVTTTQGQFVLTLFEQYSYEELPYFLELMAYLNENQVPSAHPCPDNEGHYLRYLNGKPAALVQRLRGKEMRQPTVEQCAVLGQELGHLHVVGCDFPHYRANQRGPSWWHGTGKRLLPYLQGADAALLRSELRFQYGYSAIDLPRGVIHADLFRDNALFEGDKLCGIIDFYYACHDVLLYDVAVTVNDWCSLPDGELDKVRMNALLEGYQEQRPFTDEERRAWGVMLRAAALRFWVSRLKDLHFPRAGEMTHTKNPNEYRDILKTRLDISPLSRPTYIHPLQNSAASLW